jgi:UDP-glucose 4-epimerase
MMTRILVTGSEGLIGKSISSCLSKDGYSIIGFDIASRESEDIRDSKKLEATAESCDGIIHLAAVSRVVWGHRNPVLCNEVNVTGTQNVLEAAIKSSRKPWVVFASSREVYGQQAAFPVKESADLLPMNVYAESKVQGEKLLQQYRERGLRAAVVRLSNVYGRTNDHADRVIPAFCRASLTNEALRVEGVNHVFDFMHLDDVTLGLFEIIKKLEANCADLSPIQLTSGVGTTLLELAKICIELAGNAASYIEKPSRSYDVNKFYGDPTKAKNILNWEAKVSLQEGIKKLMEDFVREGVGA